jgi:hypothetical protein
MAKILRLRRGTAEQHVTFKGLTGEITVDTTNNTIRVHDDATLGGHILATKEYVDNAIAAIASVDGGGAASEYDEDETIDGGGA